MGRPQKNTQTFPWNRDSSGGNASTLLGFNINFTFHNLILVHNTLSRLSTIMFFFFFLHNEFTQYNVNTGV